MALHMGRDSGKDKDTKDRGKGRGGDAERRRRQPGDDRRGGLDALLGTVNRTHGSGSLRLLGASDDDPEIRTFPSGSLAVDLALGNGGLPYGRIVEIFGPESSGKTTLALLAIASVQAAGGVAAFIDAEHALDPTYARRLGVNLGDLLVSQPDSGEQALQIVDALLRSESVDLVVVDSVAALVPQAEIDGEMGDQHVGLQARLMSQATRKLVGLVERGQACLFFINQIRQKIGVTFGSPETTTGGNALKFYASVRMDIRRIGTLKDGERAIGARTRVKVVKNKLAPPFRQAEFDILYGRGIPRSGELIDLGLVAGAVEKSGSWYAAFGERLGQGRDKSMQALEAQPELAARVERAIRDHALALAADALAPLPGPPTDGDGVASAA